ncbi:MAG: hypothetical protein FD173_2263 [Gallionellaceae bacterium]|nr:MAG: hypothetical protein FD173_2263 [Gallionellaceae bacterium]
MKKLFNIFSNLGIIYHKRIAASHFAFLKSVAICQVYGLLAKHMP